MHNLNSLCSEDVTDLYICKYFTLTFTTNFSVFLQWYSILQVSPTHALNAGAMHELLLGTPANSAGACDCLD